ncbi:branched-chain amino acid ABC transporter permease [Archaeoglobales archaeon]|nr:MAG: branched-chain amino acid ABC transporter permease [Archaeoglobales archaeon]
MSEFYRDPKIFVIVVLLILALAAPLFLPDAFVFLIGLTYLFIILAISWDVIVGYTGQVNLGHTVFVGIGAYTTALLQVPSRFEGTFLNALAGIPQPPVFISILLGGIVAAFVGFVIGVITLRLKGYYFALVTAVLPLVFIQFLYVWSDIFGGEEGFSVGLERALAPDSTGKYYIAFGLMVISIITLYFILRSSIGYKFRAVRDDEILAESVGIDIVKYKVLSFVISSFFAGLAGAAFVHYRITVGPSLFDIPLMLLIILAAVIGGLGTLYGPILGGFIIYLMKNWWLKSISGISAILPINDEVILYTILIIVAILAPHGIWSYIRLGVNKISGKAVR